MVLDELKILIAFILWIFWGNQTSHQFIGFRSHTNQKNGSPLVRICDFIRFEEMVYTLDVMAPIFSFVVLYQLPKRGMIHLEFPSFVYLAVFKNTLTEHKESTSTWFGLTEQHDRGHVIPNKFLGPHTLSPLSKHKNNAEKDTTLLLFFLSKSPGGRVISF